jgi:hypothetical protein
MIFIYNFTKIEVLDTNSLSEVLDLAINELNNSAKYELKIKDKSEVKYKIKLSKRSGLPDLDLPSLSYELLMKDTTERSFSIVVEDSSIIYKGELTEKKNNLELENKKEEPNQSIKQVKAESKGCCSIFGC